MKLRANFKSVSLLIALLLIFDQVTKFLVKLNMTLDQSITIFPDWFFIRFIENSGAAYGFELGGDYGKLILSLFRIAVVIFLGYYIAKQIKEKSPTGFIIGLVLIFAGAVGNIIDCAVYGLIFSESTVNSVAQFMPEAGGYTTFLHGKVVDMLYFPIIDTVYPDWMPVVGGDRFLFFSPIFNVADSYITIGVIYLLLFQRKMFK